MKKIIFIDNDNPINNRDFEDDMHYAQRALRNNFNISVEDVESMQIVDDFYHKSQGNKEEMIELLYNKSNIIATRSMYTTSHFNSLGSFMYFLAGAGRYNISGKVYLDCTSSDYMIDALNRNIEFEKHPLHVLKGVVSNHLISYDRETKSIVRVDIAREGYDFFKYVPLSDEEFQELVKECGE